MFGPTRAAAAVALVSQECNRRDTIRLDFMASGYRNSVMPDEVLPLSAVLRNELVEASVQYRRQRDGTWRMRVGATAAIRAVRGHW